MKVSSTFFQIFPCLFQNHWLNRTPIVEYEDAFSSYKECLKEMNALLNKKSDAENIKTSCEVFVALFDKIILFQCWIQAST